MPDFTSEDKQRLLQEVLKWMDEADRWARFNQAWDVAFKVVILVLAVLATIVAALIAAKYKESAPPLYLTVYNLSASAVIAALSGFAFTQFDFPARQRTYETKRNSFRNVSNDLQWGDLKRGEVMQALRTIHSWDDTHPAPAKGLSKD